MKKPVKRVLLCFAAASAIGALAVFTTQVFRSVPRLHAGATVDVEMEISSDAGGWESSFLPREPARRVLSRLAPLIAGRSLREGDLPSGDEVDLSAAVERLTREPGFIDAGRRYVELLFETSGQAGGIDYDAPARLAEYLLRARIPWSQLITSDKCVIGGGALAPCDSGAPYGAGVLTTRAFLAGNASRFNLHRAIVMTRTLTCSGYPLAPEVEAPLDPAGMLPLFRNKDPNVTPAPGLNFGNGLNCYTCHGQFGVHTQFFVAFDAEGRWQSGRTGLQDPAGELGRSGNKLMVSHFEQPERARLESSRYFNRDAANLAEAARIIATSEKFVQCTAENWLRMNLPGDGGGAPPQELTRDIARHLHVAPEAATFAAIVIATATHPTVVRAILAQDQ